MSFSAVANSSRGLHPDIVSDEGFIILPEGVGLKTDPVAQNLAARIHRADRLLATAPEPAEDPVETIRRCAVSGS